MYFLFNKTERKQISDPMYEAGLTFNELCDSFVYFYA